MLECKVLNPIYIEEAKILPHKNFEFAPLSFGYVHATIRMLQIFSRTQCLKSGDKRSYIFEIKRASEETPEELRENYNRKIVELGVFKIVWINSFGERNVCNISSIQAKYEGFKERFSIRVLNTPEVLYLEEPKLLSLKITNLLPVAHQLRLYVADDKTKSIMINALSQTVIYRLTAGNRASSRLREFPS